MNTKKVIYVIPGFRHKSTTKAYIAIAKMLRKEGYRPVVMNIAWKKTTISENTQYFLKQYKKIKSRNKYILGFSFGAMIAFLASTKIRPAGLILCSLSPFFKEDQQKSNTSIRNQDFATLHCGTLAKKIKAKEVTMLYGAKETPLLKKRVALAYRRIASPQKKLISIKKTEHDISDKRYLDTIHHVAQGFNASFIG